MVEPKIKLEVYAIMTVKRFGRDVLTKLLVDTFEADEDSGKSTPTGTIFYLDDTLTRIIPGHLMVQRASDTPVEPEDVVPDEQ